MCVETTARMAGNLGFDTYLAHDACAAGNRRSPDGVEFEADTVHRMSVANLHAEFCTAIKSETLAALLHADAAQCHRVQGNE
jgi:nicotinamidase-related amidase